MRPPSTRSLVALLAFVLGLAVIPHRVCERDAPAWFDGEASRTESLASTVAAWSPSDLAPTSFATGSRRFDAEWVFGSQMMAAMGFGQLALEHPPERSRESLKIRTESLRRMETCLDRMLAANTFDQEAWGQDPIASAHAATTDEDRGHAAFLGYAALALGIHRVLVPSSRWNDVHDAIIAALERRIDASPTGLVETYPGEVYPVDNTSAVGAIALHALATHRPAPPALARGLAAIDRAIDPSTGLLVQSVDVTDASPRDAPRASGTALASYFLAYADDAISSKLWRALEGSQMRTVLGFGAMLESPALGARRVDIDSGPVVLGFGVSATGFAIGASRIHGDRETFSSLYATAHLFGVPFDEDGARTHVTGGPIGDAILFAMLTAPKSTTLAGLRRST